MGTFNNNMDVNFYQELVQRTAGSHETKEMQLCNWAMGLCGEAGEYTELIKKHVFHGKPLDRVKAIKELGDVCWYLTMCATELDLTLSEIMATNIEKLKERYPNGFVNGGGNR
jgi:NTP pyrophosphatase (non-canonical NTP hydrolase)